MFLVSALVLILLINSSSAYEENDGMIVTINDGKILGRHMLSQSGRTIRAFTGIPYAKPPVGELRFKPAQKMTPWDGILRTQNRPPLCIQFNPFTRVFKVEGQEDCLYLNVYAPEKYSKKLPVLVYIHGGGWIRGEAYPYSPDYLLDHDIVYVAANYRVGAMGFMSTEDENCPGNYGFKDQSFVLRWIQENIEYFGGDKSNVTLWGESAGGASVNYHMFSPMSRGLFHRAIIHSSTFNNGWAEPSRDGMARLRAMELAERVNCKSSDTKSVIECLRKVDAKTITEATMKMYFWDNDPVVLFKPVIEDSEWLEEPFITDRSYAEHSADIPLLIGMNSEEGLLKVAGIFEYDELFSDLIENWDEILPHSFYYDHLDDDSQMKITKMLNEFYFGNETVSDGMRTDKKGLIDLWTDGWFIGMFENIKERFEHKGNAETYVFYFSHKSTASFSQSNDFLGTCHVDELIPLFALRKAFFFSSIPTVHDKELTRVMTRMWVNFARTGQPNSNSSSELPQWPPATSITSLKYLQIGNENGHTQSLFQTKENFLTERAAFWMKLRDDFKLNTWKHNTGNANKWKIPLLLISILLLSLKFIR